MALSAYLNELNQKHARLDEKIQNEMKHPAPDTLRIVDLKKRKLQIKEKLRRYTAG